MRLMSLQKWVLAIISMVMVTGVLPAYSDEGDPGNGETIYLKRCVMAWMVMDSGLVPIVWFPHPEILHPACSRLCPLLSKGIFPRIRTSTK